MIRYLSVPEVIELNKRIIRAYSDIEQVGVKEYSLLESAVYRPQQTIFGEDAYRDIWDKGAALFESIAKNHAFYNGNKRTALLSLIVFYHLNGIEFKMNEKEAEDFTVDVVVGKYTFEEISKIIRSNSSIGEY